MPCVGSWLSQNSFKQRLVADPLGVVDDEHRLVMAGPARADLLIGRVRREPAGIADRGDMDAGDLPELPLGAPEAAEPEQRRLGALRVGAFEGGAAHEMGLGGGNGLRPAGQRLVG